MGYLENDRIRLRALEPSDVELLYVWENDTELWQVGDTLTPYSRKVLQQYIESAHSGIHEQKQLRLVIEVKDETIARAVGLVDLFDVDFMHGRAGVGILIYSPDERRKGYAADALQLLADYSFGVLGLHQLYCHVATDNTASISLFEKSGFTQAGVLTEWRKTHKGWQDVLILQLIGRQS